MASRNVVGGVVLSFLMAAGTVSALAGDAPMPVTTSDPAVAVDKLSLLLQPLTKEELAVEAAAWQALVKAKVTELVNVEISLQTAKDDERAKLLEAATKLRDERTAIIDRTNAVNKAWTAKGGDAAAIEKYLTAVSGINLNVKDTSAAWSAVLGWLKSPQGGIRWAVNLVLFVVVLFAFKILSVIVAAGTRKAIKTAYSKSSGLLLEFIDNSLRKVVLIIGIVVALSMLEVNIAPLLAGLGVVGFVLGFAFQNSLGHLAAGFMILLYRPFDMGDMVTAAGQTGKVESMSLVSTTLRNADGHSVIVPNSAIWSAVITNQSRSIAPAAPQPKG